MKHKDVLSEVKRKLTVMEGVGILNREVEKRVTPRWKLEKVLFRSSLHGKIFSVVDLSLGGMSLALSVDDQKDWVPGLQIQGVLSCYSEKLPIQARVRFKKGNRVGCEFESLLSSVQVHLERFLKPEVLGEMLKWIPFQEAQADWFVGPCGTSLLIRRGQAQEPLHISAYFLGKYFQWEKHSGMATGIFTVSDDPDESRGLFQLQTYLLEKDPEFDSLKLSIAKKVILSSNISQELKAWCNDHIF
ncbi:PilZ domain-containing protein [bacterium]|nr:PilZ domain-containing protein [bacterium]